MGPSRLSAVLVRSALALISGMGCAPADPGASGPPGEGEEKVSLGSLKGVVQRLHSEVPSHSRRFGFPIGGGAEVQALVQAYDEGGGRLSMTGRAADSLDSEFILKANDDSLYGWIAYRDRGLAWEITTGDDGKVSAAQVPLEKIFPVCPVPGDDPEPMPAEEPSVLFAAAAGFPGHVGTYPGTDVTKLQSRPESQKVWYIDFTDTMNGSEPKSGHTKEDVWVTWAITAATLYPFDVNVTTDPAVYAAAGVANSGCTGMIYEGIGDGSSCGINIFGTRSCCDNHLYANGYATGRIVNHEAGHGWGLLHDGGDNGGEYFEGFSEFQWTPLMGNIWPGDRWQQALFQYSKGEYTSATQKQDDLAIIDRSLDYVADDIPETTPLVLDGTNVAAETNWGQIAKNTDTDSWAFEIGPGGGHATLKVDRIEHRGGAMLDVDASIVDSMGSTVVQNNAAVARSAQLNVDLPAGRYTVLVKGGGEGTPQHGFPAYSSVGLYAISGTLTGSLSMGGTGGMGAGGMGASGAGGMGLSGMGGMGASGAGGVGIGGAAGSGAAGGNGGAGAGSGGSDGLAGTAGIAPGGAGGQATSGTAGTLGTSGGSGGLATGGAPAAGTGGVATAGDGGASTSGGFAGLPGAGGSGAPLPGHPLSTDPASGCGCRVAGGGTPSSWWLLTLAGITGTFLRRRYPRRSTSRSTVLANSR